MTVFQQSSEATMEDKQLRIVGDPSKVDYAKQLINDLLTEKEIESVKMKTKAKECLVNEYGSARSDTVTLSVPPNLIGLGNDELQFILKLHLHFVTVIGKGGESIKRIQQETGTKIQFDTTKSDAKGNKICTVSGNADAVACAADMIREIIDNATVS